MLKIKKMLSKRKTIKYYAKKYGYKVENIIFYKLQSDEKIKTYAVILINKGTRNSYKDWLSYRGSYDLALFLNENLEIIKIKTELIFDVSLFADGKRIEFKKPRKINLSDKEIKNIKNSEIKFVWSD